MKHWLSFQKKCKNETICSTRMLRARCVEMTISTTRCSISHKVLKYSLIQCSSLTLRITWHRSWTCSTTSCSRHSLASSPWPRPTLAAWTDTLTLFRRKSMKQRKSANFKDNWLNNWPRSMSKTITWKEKIKILTRIYCMRPVAKWNERSKLTICGQTCWLSNSKWVRFVQLSQRR